MGPEIRRAGALITVCICSHGRPDYVQDCFDGLRRQTAPFTLIVVDSASPPDAAAALQSLVADMPYARLIRLDRPGLSAARNAALAAVPTGYVAFIDDDAIPAPDYIAAIARAVADAPGAAVMGGQVLPSWEAPLPDWWPARLRGVLSIVEGEGCGAYGEPGAAQFLAPCGANFIVLAEAARAIGGFSERVGRIGDILLSDEETLLTHLLCRAGHTTWYDSRILVHHQIQAHRLEPRWLLSRMYWQGASSVMSDRASDRRAAVTRALPRRLLVAVLLAALAVVPRNSTWLMPLRWRRAYAAGFTRAALGWLRLRA